MYEYGNVTMRKIRMRSRREERGGGMKTTKKDEQTLPLADFDVTGGCRECDFRVIWEVDLVTW